MSDYAIQTYVSGNYQDRLEFCLPSMLRTQCRDVWIETDDTAWLKVPPPPRVLVSRRFRKPENWARTDARKLTALLYLLKKCRVPVFQCDADCLILRDPGEVFEAQPDFDLAFTTYTVDPKLEFEEVVPMVTELPGCDMPLGAIWARPTPLAIEFLRHWREVQNEFAARGEGSEIPDTGIALSHHMLTFFRIHRNREYDPATRILWLNRLIFNSFTMNPSQGQRDRWLTQLRRITGRVVMLHYPQKQYADEMFVRDSTTAATGDPQWWAQDRAHAGRIEWNLNQQGG